MTTQGIHSISDLLAVETSTAASIGLENINSILQSQLSYDNNLVGQALADLAQPVTTQQKAWGLFNDSDMTEVDEYGKALPAKLGAPLVAAFPLRKFSYHLGWTQDYFELASGADIAKQYLALQDAYQRAIMDSVKKALFRKDAITFVDRLTNNVSLTVKRLWDNDSGDVPPTAPDGTTFLNSHTHYASDTEISAAGIDAMCKHVTEHGNYRGVKIYMSAAAADVEDVKALTGFVPLTPAYIVSMGSSVQTYQRFAADTDQSNTIIGFWKNGEEIWTKPFMTALYMMAVATGMDDKVLGYRQRPQSSLQGLRIMPTISSDYPLFAEFAQAEFGFGVLNRGMAACYFEAGNSTWVDMV